MENLEATKARLEELVSLLLKDPISLSDSEIENISASSDELRDFLYQLRDRVYQVEEVRRYRKQKMELAKCSTNELLEMRRKNNEWRSARIREDWNDDLDDSFYEAPSLDSEEHIIYELLKEREAV